MPSSQRSTTRTESNRLRYGYAVVAQTGLADRARLTQVRLPAVQLPRPAYDLVFSNSLLHHLDDPAVLGKSVCSFMRVCKIGLDRG